MPKWIRKTIIRLSLTEKCCQRKSIHHWFEKVDREAKDTHGNVKIYHIPLTKQSEQRDREMKPSTILMASFTHAQIARQSMTKNSCAMQRCHGCTVLTMGTKESANSLNISFISFIQYCHSRLIMTTMMTVKIMKKRQSTDEPKKSRN